MVLKLAIERVLDITREFRQLQCLDLWYTLPDSGPPPEGLTQSGAQRIHDLLSVLNNFRGLSRLEKLSIQLDSGQLPDGEHTYGMTRRELLNDVLGCETLTDTLRGFPALQNLLFVLGEYDESQRSQSWWRKQVERRMQDHLRATISVELLIKDGMFPQLFHRVSG